MTRRERPLAGIGLVVLMTVLFAGMDTSIRWLGGAMPVLLMLTVRYAFQAVAMTLWLAPRGWPGFRPQHPRFQALRGVLLLVTSVFSFFGLQHVPVPEFTAIFMLTPLLATLLAAVLLKERVTPLRALLVAGGFAGALVVIRPGMGGLGWAVLLPLAGTLAYAFFQVLTRRLAGHEDPLVTHFWTGFTGAVLLLPVLLASGVDVAGAWAAATPWQRTVLFLIGALGTFGHLMLVVAMGLAPAATLMPFVYLQIGAAALFGWWVFGQLPDGPSWAGMALIAACGASAVWLNTRRMPTP